MAASAPAGLPDLAADDRLPWLLLTHTPGLGRSAQRRLLSALGSPADVLAAPREAWHQIAGAAAAQALAAGDAEGRRREQALRSLAWLDEAPTRHHLLTLDHPAYPAALLACEDPPLLLHGVGDLRCLQAPCVAVVGSRQATAQGRDLAREFAGELARAGLTIVSGLALGIDGAAHEGALEAGGATVAVVGTGVDRVYPAAHRALAHRIAAHGLLLSELPLGSPARPAHFPSRNRIIAGLCQGTLVVEAALRSGSLITARLAAEAGREVMALPGSVRSAQSQGPHQLIRDGAALVERPEEVLALLGCAPAAPARAPVPLAQDGPAEPDTDPLLAALGQDPVSLDQLGARTGWPTETLLARLLDLELAGAVARLPGGLLQRCGRA